MLDDFEELLASLNDAGVRYLIGGAHALAIHARPRATRDLDIYLDPTTTNARRAIRALTKFFGGTAPSYINEENLTDPSTIVQLGVAPIRVDILSSLATTTFATAWKHRLDAPYGQVPAHYLGIDELIAEKTHFARPQDVADVQQLIRARDRTARKSSKPKKHK